MKKKPAPAKKAPGPARAAQSMRTKWVGLRKHEEDAPVGRRRAYKLETIGSAVDWMLTGRDRFIRKSFEDKLGPKTIVSATFSYVHEDAHHVVFSAAVLANTGRRASFALAVAKNAAECAAAAKAQHTHLGELYAQSPRMVLRPYRSGLIYLRDRHGRAGHDREIYAYVTDSPEGYATLGVASPAQFASVLPLRHTFSLEQSEIIRSRIVEVLAGAYDPLRGRCVALKELQPADFGVLQESSHQINVKLLACRRIASGMTPPKLVESLLRHAWSLRGARCQIAPALPLDFVEALALACGRATALEWIAQYLLRMETLGAKGVPSAYIRELRQAIA